MSEGRLTPGEQIRLEALKLACQTRPNDHIQLVINRADVFESFILGGKVQTEKEKS